MAPERADLLFRDWTGIRQMARARYRVSARWRGPGIELYQGDARDVLAGMPAGSVDCVVTSPPYWGLRDYRVPGQYGLEPAVEDYVAALVGVFDELAPVLTPSGAVWLNLADTFGGSWGSYIAAGSRSRTASARSGCKQGPQRPPQTRPRAKDFALTFAEIAGLPATVDLLTAGRALGIGRTTAYTLARTERCPCPVVRVGGSYRVPTVGILQLLGLDGGFGQRRNDDQRHARPPLGLPREVTAARA